VLAGLPIRTKCCACLATNNSSHIHVEGCSWLWYMTGSQARVCHHVKQQTGCHTPSSAGMHPPIYKHVPVIHMLVGPAQKPSCCPTVVTTQLTAGSQLVQSSPALPFGTQLCVQAYLCFDLDCNCPWHVTNMLPQAAPDTASTTRACVLYLQVINGYVVGPCCHRLVQRVLPHLPCQLGQA